MTILIRDERPDDVPHIATLTEVAFRNAPHTSHTEHLIVAALRAADRLSLSLVADDDGQVVGHVALSPVTLSSGDRGWLGLGPISVDPQRQGQGIGAALMQAAVQWLRTQAAAGCVVLGDPGYYRRFGFQPHLQLVLPGVPPAYFMALPLGGAVPVAEVAYDPLFAATA